MVHGETFHEHLKGKKYREFELAHEKVNQVAEYYRVEIKSCLFNDYLPRSDERISKAPGSFNMLLSSDI